MTTAWTVLIPLVDKAPNPDDVKAGWVAFGVFLALAAAVVLLAFSFRKQLRKVNFEEKEIPRRNAPRPEEAASGAPDGTAPGTSEQTAPGTSSVEHNDQARNHH